jgi:hypothetical protein
MKILIPILFLLLSVVHVSGQTLPSLYQPYKTTDTTEAGALNFRIESVGFFQNNEYLGNFLDGYTLPGFMFRPKLTFSPTKDLYIEAGAHLLKYSGRDQVSFALPWFSLRYNFSDRLSAVVGNLNQNNEHGLLEQLWEPERIYTDKPESGLQFLYSDKNLNAQTWVNWEQFIQKNDPFQERFTVGITAGYSVLNNSDLSLKIPVQILFYHQGGEININPDGPRPRVQTHANFVAGWNLALNVGERVKTLNLNGYWLGYNAVTKDTNTLPFSNGHAWLTEASARTNHSTFSLSYWNAYQFIAPQGRILYQSVSDNIPGFSRAERSMVSAKYFWQKKIAKAASVAFQVESYLDTQTGDLSYSYGFFVLLDAELLLKRF